MPLPREPSARPRGSRQVPLRDRRSHRRTGVKYVLIAQNMNMSTPQPLTHPTSLHFTSARSVAAGSTARRRRRGGGSRGCSAWRAGGGPAASPGALAMEAADPCCRCLNEQIRLPLMDRSHCHEMFSIENTLCRYILY